MTQTKRPNYVLWMLCVFMLLSAASYFFRPKEPEISYAEVVQLFEQEKVKINPPGFTTSIPLRFSFLYP